MAQYVKKKTFIKVMRGYSPEEVDAYIEYLLKKYNEVSKENEDNKRKIATALRKIQELSENRPDRTERAKSESVSNQASEEAAKLIENARTQERRILEDAAKQAEKILRDAEEEAYKRAEAITSEAEKSVSESEACVRAQYDAAQKLYTEVFSFRDKLFGMYNDHIEMLENIAEEANAYYDNVADAGLALDDSLTEGESVPDESVSEEKPELAEELFAPDDDPSACAEQTEPEPEKTEMTDDVMAEVDDIIPDDLLSDLPDPAEEENSGEIAKYLSLMNDDTGLDDADDEIDLRIDWKNRKSKEQNPEVLSSFAYDAAEEEDVPADKTSDFQDLDDLLENGGKSVNDFSLTDEFDIVYSNRNSTKNVEEIVKQPLVAPEKPSNPKKHKIL